MDIIKSIQIFQQVAKEQSFTRAAEQLNLVPSAVSRQINELEKWLGIRLINRTTRSLHLTKEGRDYLEKMALILDQVESLQQSPQNPQTLKGKLRITAPMMIGQHILPEILSGFKSQHSEVQISLSLMNRKVDLIEEDYDLAIRAGHLADSNLYARELGHIAFKTVAAPSYLETRPPLLMPKDLADHNCLINTALTTPKRWRYKIEDKNKMVKVNGDLETNESLCLLTFAKAGHGVALLPELYVNQDIAEGSLVEVLADFAPEPLPVHILYASNRFLNPTLKALIRHISDQFNHRL
ncbi:MAG: LysR family transcriptional regulator [Marinomonas sp.]